MSKLVSRNLLIFVMLLGMLLTVSAQKPHSASKNLEIHNLKPITTYKAVNGKIDRTTGIWRFKTNLEAKVTPGTPEQMAREFVSRYQTRTFPKNDVSQLKAVHVSESPAGYHVRFQQTINDIPVYRSDMTVTIRKSDYTVTAVANNLRPAIRMKSMQPVIDKKTAIDIAMKKLDVKEQPSILKSQLSILDTKDRGPVLTHHVTMVTMKPMGDWQVFVDARTGEVLHIEDIMRYSKKKADGSGMVFEPDPLTTAGVTYGAPYSDQNDTDVTELNNERVNVVLRDLTKQGDNYILEGPYVVLSDLESPTDNFPALSDSTEFNFTRAQEEFEDVMVYYHVDLSYRRLMELGFNIPSLLAFQADPHGLNGDDNSHFVPSGNYCAWGEGGVDDAEDADVIWHEYAHAIQDNITGGMAYTGETQSLQEGSSDYWAVSYSRSISDYDWYKVFNWDGHNEFWSGRLANLNWVYPDDYVSGHNGGQLWSSALMVIWEQLGRDITDRLFIQAHYIWGTSPGLQDAAEAFIQADRDLYGGAHLSVIIPVFDQRGLVNAEDYIPSITHTPLSDTEDITGPYQVIAEVIPALSPIQSVNLVYGYGSLASPDTLEMVATGEPNQFTADIPGGQGTDFDVAYYIFAVDTSGNIAYHPANAPTDYHTFHVGADTEAPVITHSPLNDTPLLRWPATVRATVTDNLGVDTVYVSYVVNNGQIIGAFPLVNTSGNNYSGMFDLDTTQVHIGDSVEYRITASDIATIPNIGNSPESGFHKFYIIDTKGLVLIVNDDNAGKTVISGPKGTYQRTIETGKTSADSMSTLLTNAGYIVDVVTMNAVASDSVLLSDYDLVIHSSGGNTTTMENPTYRDKLIAWITEDMNHKLLIEGGEIGYDWYDTPEVGLPLLHTDSWDADDAGPLNLISGMENHPIVSIIYQLPATLSLNYQGYGDEDAVSQVNGAYPVYETNNNPGLAGIGVYNPIPDPNFAQIVYYAFNFNSLADQVVAQQLLENTAEYLLTPAVTPTGELTVTVDLSDTDDESDVAVRLYNSYMDTTAMTPANGIVSFTSLYATEYYLEISKAGYSPVAVRDTVSVTYDAPVAVNYELIRNSENTIVYGNVSLADNGPAVGAVVTIEGQGLTDTTDINGDYSINSITAGEITVSFKYPGYTPQFITATIAVDSSLEMNVTLEPGYFNGFEAGAGGITLTGDFEAGVPTSGPGSAYEGTNVAAVNLGGDYPSNSASELILPEFDLSGMNNPIFSGYFWYSIETRWDGFNIKISTDGGSTFSILEPSGGYNTAEVSALGNEPGFSGNNGMWELIQFNLASFAGQTVIIKIEFASDGTVNYPGVYVDNLSINEGEIINAPTDLTATFQNGVRAVELNWQIYRKMFKDVLRKLQTKTYSKSNSDYKQQPLKALQGFNVYRAEADGPFNMVNTEAIPDSITNYTDTTFSFDTQLYYFVEAVFETGSATSDTINVFVRSEAPFFSESFENDTVGTLPEGWFQIDNDGGPGNPQFPGQWQISDHVLSGTGTPVPIPGHTGDQWVGVGYNTGSPPPANDDYLVMPKLGINDNAALEFWASSTDPSYLDALKVKVAVTPSTPNAEDFTDELLDIPEVPVEWTKYTVDLSAYTGQEIYIAFNYYSTDKYLIKIDDVELYGDMVLSVNDPADPVAPTQFKLDQNYPNPFNPTTSIHFEIPQNTDVKLTIFNMLGQEVKTLVNKQMAAGKYDVVWDATNNAGQVVSSGIYFYRIEAGSFVKTAKMLLLK